MAALTLNSKIWSLKYVLICTKPRNAPMVIPNAIPDKNRTVQYWNIMPIISKLTLLAVVLIIDCMELPDMIYNGMLIGRVIN